MTADDHLSRVVDRYPALAPCRPSLDKAFRLLVSVWDRGGRLMVCGNGGSAADSDHIVSELVKGFLLKRPLSSENAQRLRAMGEEGVSLAGQLQNGLPTIALTGCGAFASAWANDVDPVSVFAQQVHVQGRPGDCLLAISTSGVSRNVIQAAVTARALGIAVIGLTGADGGRLATLSAVCVRAPATATPEVQEFHIAIYHALCAAVEAHYFS